MDCNVCRELLEERIDGLLTLERAKELDGHLATCPSCRAELALLERLDEALAEQSLERAPADLARSVAREVSARVRRRDRLERAAILVGVPGGLASLGLAIKAATAPEGGVVEMASRAAARFSAPLVERLSDLAGGAGPGASMGADLQGVVWALAAAALSLFAITALRLARGRALGWN